MAAWTGRGLGASGGLLVVLALALACGPPAGTGWAGLRRDAPDDGLRQAIPVEAASEALPPPDDPGYWQWSAGLPLQWSLHELDALDAWARYPGSYFDDATRPPDTPIIALIDTGVDVSHPDFLNVGAAGPEVVQGGQLLASAARTFLGAEARPGARDEHGHGTHLAGIIAAAANNGPTAGGGVAGLGYPLRLLPIRVTDETGTATHASLAAAIRYACDQGAAVIVVGLAGPTWSQELQDAVDYAWERGCFLVAPAGDTGGEEPVFPAACPHVFGVAATTAGGGLAWYGSRGEQVALAAPGGDEQTGIYSTLPTQACTLRPDLSGPAYGRLFGSAQAAAHLAAAAGLWLATDTARQDGEAPNRAAWRALQTSAASMDEAAGWRPDRGYGLLSPASLLAEERRPAAGPGSVVGRVVSQGAPAPGAVVEAISADGQHHSCTTRWPAGSYRLANLPPGVYQVRASAGGGSGSWEGVVVETGADAPGIDFWLGSPPADSVVLASALPQAAICGQPTAVSVTFRNTGSGFWRRREGHCLREVGDTPEPGQWELPAGVEVGPGQGHEFSFSWQPPTHHGWYWLAFQMCQQGGQGRFGQTAGRLVAVSPFFDVPPDHWAVAAVQAVKAAGIVQGYPGDVYLPDQAVTRAQLAVFLARALAGGESGVPASPAQPAFPDVPASHWAYRHIAYCHDHGIVQGYGDGYHPEEVVDRAQMAVFLARAMCGGEEAVPDTGCSEPVFPDIHCDFWARKYIHFLKAAAVTAGYPDGTYRPAYPVTRDQMAVYVARAFQLPM